MKKKFLLMGTDVRQQYLKEMLEQQGHHTEWIQTLTPVDAAEYDAVLLPVSDSRAYYDQVADSVHGGQLIFGCNLPKKKPDKIWWKMCRSLLSICRKMTRRIIMRWQRQKVRLRKRFFTVQSICAVQKVF